jgi:predicted enzyme related to lactoylglutathione lyase
MLVPGILKTIGETTMPNPFVHVELNSTDVPRAKSFYQKLFAWKLKDVPMQEDITYTTISVGKGTGGGMMKQLMPDTPSMWLPYVLVDDIEVATARAEKLGAKICKGVTDVMGMGRLSIFEDPTGAVIGLWEPKKMSAAKSARSRAGSRRKPAKRGAKRR